MSELIETLKTLLGDGGVLLGDDVTSRAAGWRGGNTEALAVLRPRTTEQVSDIMRACHAAGQSVVIQGGKTGLVNGADSRAGDVALSMELMNQVEELDKNNRSMTVQAGVILQAIQQQAADAGLQFPLDLGARGSATIGGNISTNAGGNRVIRYGMTRQQILGLEVVLADGTVISSMSKVLKNNAAYDLKQLFIGSEGTLGTVTRAVLRLGPALNSENTALLALHDYSQVIELLHYCDREFGGSLSSFEVMWNNYYRYVTANNEFGKAPPLSRDYPFYVLIETQGTHQQTDQDRFEAVLSAAMEEGGVVDAVLAKSGSERNALWAIRDNIEAMGVLGPVFYFDISLPIDEVEAYLVEAEENLRAQWPNMRHAVFGHLGDGNIHIIACIDTDDAEERYRFDDILYQGLKSRGGSISAEHGIGEEKKPFLHYSRSEEEIALMKTLKLALDPKGILNPGKVI
jgi:FAD/FMN-containing dehydrogenase